MKNIINRTPADWCFINESKSLTNYCNSNAISQNAALAKFADELNAKFERLSQSRPWNTFTYQMVDSILRDYAAYGATDSEGFTCAAELLIELYDLKGQEAKIAYCQFRYPAPSKQDEKLIAALKAMIGEQV